MCQWGIVATMRNDEKPTNQAGTNETGPKVAPVRRRPRAPLPAALVGDSGGAPADLGGGSGGAGALGGAGARDRCAHPPTRSKNVRPREIQASPQARKSPSDDDPLDTRSRTVLRSRGLQRRERGRGAEDGERDAAGAPQRTRPYGVPLTAERREEGARHARQRRRHCCGRPVPLSPAGRLGSSGPRELTSRWTADRSP